MNIGLAGVLRGLPGLLGVLAGIGLYATTLVQPVFCLPILLLVALVVLLLLSRKVFLKHPRLALILLEPWVLSAVCIVALCTELILWLTITSPDWFPELQKPRLDAVTGALIGALTTYLATVWTKDVAESKGPFLPSTQFEQSLARDFSKTYHLTGDTIEWEACHAEAVRNGVKGWGLVSRWKRAKILSDYLWTK